MSTESELVDLAPIVLPLLYELIKDLKNGLLKPEDIARRIVGIGMKVVPYDDLKLYLTKDGRERGDLLANIAEDEKFLDEDGNP